jgi:short subunit dehydrogenase-like uncharacterized protein
MPGALLIYGANGYTGRLVAERAAASSLRPILAGRRADQVAALAGSLGLEHRVARLSEPELLAAALRDVSVVVHAAGPFSDTAASMLDACLRTGTHYLDLNGDVSVYEALARRHREAMRRGVMVMPGVGFDVVASDCLVAHVARRLPGARRLAVGLSGLRFASRGSAKTLLEQAGRGILVRRDGRLVRIPAGTLERSFDYGDGPQPSYAISWGDVASAFYTTGIPNIETYFEANPALSGMLAASRWAGWALDTAPAQVLLHAWAELLDDGPTAEQRAAMGMVLVAEVEDAAGRTARARLRTREAYTFTAEAAVAVAARVLAGDIECGFQTPGRVYGPEFVCGLGGVTREDMA